jgi:YidC/Oxa1 family membrane protein insertase
VNPFIILLVQPLANGLALFYNLLGGNLGLAIIGFSLTLRIALTPLTKPYMNSMKKLKEYGPQLAKLKEKHKGDKQKLTKAQADFYKEKGINPAAGCLPYLLQIVILIALFNVFNKVLVGGGDIVTRFNSLLYDPLKFVDGTTINTHFLYLDLVKPDIFKVSGIPFALPGLFLFLAAFFQFVSAKMAAPYVEVEKKLAKKTEDTTDDMAAAMQSSAIYTFPLMTLFIGVRFASGLALYWLLFSLYQMVQQYRSAGWGGLTPWIKKIRAFTTKTSTSGRK